MVNSSYTYSVFGLAFSMFAIGGLVFWLPTFLLVVHELPAARVSSWLAVTVPAAMVLGMVIGGWLADRYARIAPRALFLVPGTAMLVLDPVPAAGDLRAERSGDLSGRLRGHRLDVHQRRTVLCDHRQRGDAEHASRRLRRGDRGNTLAGRYLVADPRWAGWPRPSARPIRWPRRLARPWRPSAPCPGPSPATTRKTSIAALLTAVPALLIAGVRPAGRRRHLPREMALMLAKLRAAPASPGARAVLATFRAHP